MYQAHWWSAVCLPHKFIFPACILVVCVLSMDVQDTTPDLYLAPSLKLAQQHLQPLLDEAADIQRRLEALEGLA